mmetsp:Transcript_126322/g.352001  ORF Transcript_126322/g.352001 Transcript_126322/m.352001 type:complete len:202 (-) Transcript_126322:223-828(-)
MSRRPTSCVTAFGSTSLSLRTPVITSRTILLIPNMSATLAKPVKSRSMRGVLTKYMVTPPTLPGMPSMTGRMRMAASPRRTKLCIPTVMFMAVSSTRMLDSYSTNICTFEPPNTVDATCSPVIFGRDVPSVNWLKRMSLSCDETLSAFSWILGSTISSTMVCATLSISGHSNSMILFNQASASSVAISGRHVVAKSFNFLA